MKEISLTIPMDVSALNCAGNMLLTLALDLERAVEPPLPLGDLGTETPVTAVEESDPKSQPVPVIAATEPVTPTPTISEVSVPTATVAVPSGVESQNPNASHARDNPSSEITLPAGVELDSEGLPWDYRIHAVSKARLTKDNSWRRKRGIDPTLVTQVEAELRAAMSATGNVAVDPSPIPATPASPVVVPTTVADAVSPVSTPTPSVFATPVATVATFPALMAAITSCGIDAVKVADACRAQGLPSLPLLAARPDLIPAVAAALGV